MSVRPLETALLSAANRPSASAAQDTLRDAFAELLGHPIPSAFATKAPPVSILEELALDGYLRRLVNYPSPAGGVIPAYLLLPKTRSIGAVIAYHQHNSEGHLGKSEVVGLAGASLQAFAPELARRGAAVLAPDAVGFEDRRSSGPGLDRRDDDGSQYLREMTTRLVAGRLLITDVLADAATALTALRELIQIDVSRIGVVGYSFGGHVALFHAALHERVQFACVSGAARSYADRLSNRTGISAGQAIPGILYVTDLHGIAALVSPRPLHLISATNDCYALDAQEIEASARVVYSALDASENLTHLHVEGQHALDAKRAANLVDWLARA